MRSNGPDPAIQTRPAWLTPELEAARRDLAREIAILVVHQTRRLQAEAKGKEDLPDEV